MASKEGLMSLDSPAEKPLGIRALPWNVDIKGKVRDKTGSERIADYGAAADDRPHRPARAGRLLRRAVPAPPPRGRAGSNEAAVRVAHLLGIGPQRRIELFSKKASNMPRFEFGGGIFRS